MAKRKPRKTPERVKPQSGPIRVEVPQQLYQRMDAISALAKAIQNLSVALQEPGAQITISDCHITAGSEPGIEIKPTP